MSTERTLIVEADGGSRGNPGPAGYGAVVRDAASGRVIAERAASIGRATNNVAEYSGLIAGLRAVAELTAPSTGSVTVEVRMDSKLVVEQMSGRWKIKHPSMRPLAEEATGLARDFAAVRYRWIPRERNGDADRLANEAMDAAAAGRTWEPTEPQSPDPEPHRAPTTPRNRPHSKIHLHGSPWGAKRTRTPPRRPVCTLHTRSPRKQRHRAWSWPMNDGTASHERASGGPPIRRQDGPWEPRRQPRRTRHIYRPILLLQVVEDGLAREMSCDRWRVRSGMGWGDVSSRCFWWRSVCAWPAAARGPRQRTGAGTRAPGGRGYGLPSPRQASAGPRHRPAA